MIYGATTTTSTTVAASKITISAAAKPGLRVFLVCASFTTDLVGAFDCQDGTTSVFQCKAEVRAATYVNPVFTPAFPIPISSTGAAALFILNTTTTGRLSVVYTYGV
jgi:hypothetical protein